MNIVKKCALCGIALLSALGLAGCGNQNATGGSGLNCHHGSYVLENTSQGAKIDDVVEVTKHHMMVQTAMRPDKKAFRIAQKRLASMPSKTRKAASMQLKKMEKQISQAQRQIQSKRLDFYINSAKKHGHDYTLKGHFVKSDTNPNMYNSLKSQKSSFHNFPIKLTKKTLLLDPRTHNKQTRMEREQARAHHIPYQDKRVSSKKTNKILNEDGLDTSLK